MSTPTIDATVGGTNANSFGTRAEADAYFDTVLHPDAPWPSNVSATAVIGTGANGTVTVTVTAPGTEGNSNQIEVVDGVGPNVPMSAALIGQKITVTLGTDGAGLESAAKNTAILVAGAISAISGFSATYSGTGGSAVSVKAAFNFSGGSYREETKNPALIMAQRLLTSLVEWTGFVTSTSQKLPWPRSAMVKRNEIAWVDTNTIPDEVKWAQFELARLLVNSDRTVEFDIGTQGITYIRASSITLKFKENNDGPPVIPEVVWGLLVPSWYTRIWGVPQQNLQLERA